MDKSHEWKFIKYTTYIRVCGLSVGYNGFATAYTWFL